MPNDDHHPVVVDLERYELRRGEKRVALTRTEREMLGLFLLRNREALRREDILDTVWGRNVVVGHSNVDNVVARLRSKFRSLDRDNIPIITVWGTGYLWRE